MKVAILIMSADAQPSTRNVQAMKETFIRYSNEINLKHEYDFYAYYYDSNDPNLSENQLVVDDDPDYKNYHVIRIGGIETVYRTYEKTYMVYDYLMNNIGGYDRFVRINSSAYLNIKLLDAVISSTGEYEIYANAINAFVNGNFEYLNGLYPRGDFYMTSNTVIKGILEHGKELLYADTLLKNRPAVTHVDDTLFGYAFLMFMGDEYFEHLYCIYYNFFPHREISPLNLTDERAALAIASRVKSVPAGGFSGYSWDDNEYRLHDPEKMKTVHEYVKSLEYDEKFTINDLILEQDQERITLALNPVNAHPWEIKEALRERLRLQNR